jgi:hypothetical protein
LEVAVQQALALVGGADKIPYLVPLLPLVAVEEDMEILQAEPLG